uniref:Small ribosomal subunit protein bS16 n=1 Tax=candidate division CPR3 bacterium TaxID=2268181 RepID=A0A7C4M060_UNCC3
MLRIKLTRYGKKDRPTWRVVVVEKTKTGKGRVSDYIGNYDPHQKSKVFNLDLEKYEKWVKNGAQPTDSILRLKGRFIDKNKDYQKIVATKIYKSKKPEEAPAKVDKVEKPIESEEKSEVSETEEPKTEESPIEEKSEDIAVETPIEEVKEESKSEESKEDTVESPAEEKTEE